MSTEYDGNLIEGGARSFQVEVVGVEKDILRCAYSNLSTHWELSAKCEGGLGESQDPDKARFWNDHKHGTRNGVSLSTLWEMGKTADGRDCTDPICCCRDHYGEDCMDEKTIYVAKPLALRQTPWDGKTIKYYQGTADEVSINYAYLTAQKRTATYSVESARCDQGLHQEIIWPAYRERVDKIFDITMGSPGDEIWVMANIADVRTDLLDAQPDPQYLPCQGAKDCKENYKLHNINLPGAEAFYHIDMNRDGRRWDDDCGKGGGGGASVWV